MKNKADISRTKKIGKQKRYAKNIEHKNIHANNKTQKNSAINGERAYKILSIQLSISANKAKELIDSGRVSLKGKRIGIARTLFPVNTHFDIMQEKSPILFEDENILVIDKSIGVESYSLEQMYSKYKLINRLDKDTSGIILIAKNEEFRQKAIEEFRQKRVNKIYFALVEGKIYDEMTINKNIAIIKDSKAKGYVSKSGLEAITEIKPIQILEQKTLLEVKIPTGRTHQIRIHLSSIKHPIIGDIIYNKDSKFKSKRLMLHCYKTDLLNYNFESKINIHDIFEI